MHRLIVVIIIIVIVIIVILLRFLSPPRTIVLSTDRRNGRFQRFRLSIAGVPENPGTILDFRGASAFWFVILFVARAEVGLNNIYLSSSFISFFSDGHPMSRNKNDDDSSSSSSVERAQALKDQGNDFFRKVILM
jgi:hypothetical protein